MSHWFSVKTKFESLSAMQKAADELGFQLRYRTEARGYNGKKTPCDLVLCLPGEYDIGFNKQTDGSYTVIADFWSDNISKYLADPELLEKAKELYPKIAKEHGKNAAENYLADVKMGNFTKKYSYHLMKELIDSVGVNYTQAVTEDGSIKMELTGEPYLQGGY
jgi:hypothetical protein